MKRTGVYRTELNEENWSLQDDLNEENRSLQYGAE